MRANKRKDTKPELLIRSILHARGLRYLVDHAPVKGLRRRADIVLTRARISVFIDGCFWHGCPEHYIPPASNAEYWLTKIQRNRERDKETDRLLTESGWLVLRAWEHEDPSEVADRIVLQWQKRTGRGFSNAGRPG